MNNILFNANYGPSKGNKMLSGHVHGYIVE